jgi:hypothetical protein
MREILATILFVFCVACGFCAACGGIHPEGGAIDSDLFGVYTIDDYLINLDGCDDAAEVTPPPATRIVLYGYTQESSSEICLGGSFCSSVRACRDVAHAALTPLMGYSFVEGDDDGGWTGFAFAGGPSYNGERFGLVQEHMLIRTADGIRAETRTLESLGHPSYENGSCNNADARRTIMGQPCVELLVLEGTFEAGL